MARIITIEGMRIGVPDDATDAEVAQILNARLAQQPPAQPPVPPDGFIDNTLDVLGETANAANRAITEGIDFLGPGTINAGLRLAGAEYQLPTLSGGLDMLPGGQGGFMEEGTARDAVRGFGTALGTAPGLVSAGPRNMARVKDAALELAGAGAGTQPAVAGTAILGDMVDSPDRLVAAADAAGYPITPGERLGSQTLKDLEASIDSRPMLFNPMHRIKDQRQEMMNEAVRTATGVPSGERLLPETIGRLADDLSDEFNRLDFESDLVVDEKFQDALASAEETASRRVFKDPAQVEKTIDGIMDKISEQGTLSAREYQDLSSEFKKKIRESRKAGPSGSPDPQFADTLSEIVKALDDLAEDNIDPDALMALRLARKKYRALTQVENSGALRQSGDVSGPLLGNYLRRWDRPGYARGKNRSDMYNMARMTQAFPARSDSGTATRQFFNQLSLNPGASMLAMATAPLTSGLANAYMVAPEVIAAGSRMAQRNPAVLRYLAEGTSQPNRFFGAPLRSGYGILEED